MFLNPFPQVDHWCPGHPTDTKIDGEFNESEFLWLFTRGCAKKDSKKDCESKFSFNALKGEGIAQSFSKIFCSTPAYIFHFSTNHNT